MPTDDDRREVARRLREREDELTYDSISLEKGLIDIVGKDGCDYVRRLADLIEPDEPKVRCVAEVKVDGERLEKLAHDAAVELTGIDRDALLELADEIDAAVDRLLEEPELLVGATGLMRCYAYSIREALGVVDGQEP